MTKEKRKPIKGIYILSCPDTGEVRYIGQSKDAAKRFTGHMSARGEFPCPRWIKGLRAEGKLPKMTLVFKSDDLDADEIELIAQYKELGANLLNVTPGGNPNGYAYSSRPWSGSYSNVCPSAVLFKRWSMASHKDRARYFELSNPLKAVLNSLGDADRMRRELSIGEALYNGGYKKEVTTWFQSVYEDAIRLVPELRAELAGN